MKKNLMISSKLLLRSKRNKLSIIITILLMILIVIIGSYKTTEDKNLNEDFQKNPYYKYLDVQEINTNEDPNHEITKEEYEKTKKKLLSIDHVVNVVNANFYLRNVFLENTDRNVVLYSLSDTSLNILKGRNINYDSNEYEMICPINFNPISDSTGEEKFTKADYIDLEDKIDSNITLTYSDNYNGDEYKINIKLVGLYENISARSNNVCYTTEAALHEIAVKEEQNKEEYTESSAIEYFHLNTIEIDDIDNIEYVKNELNKNNFTYDEVYIKNEEETSKLYKKIYCFIIFIFIIYILFTTQMVIKNYKENKKNLLILKYLGYERKDQKNIYILNSIQILLISFIITLIITLIFKLVINKVLYYYPNIFIKQTIHINISYLFIALIINFIIIIFYGNYKRGRKKC